MKRNPQDLEKIAHLTLEHYNQYAEEFWQGTRDHDVSQNIAALLQYIRNEPPFKILDFGCGPGRDLKTFAELGHIAIGLEGAEHLAVMARAHSGCEVWQQRSEEHTSELQSLRHLVCRLLLEKKNKPIRWNEHLNQFDPLRRKLQPPRGNTRCT